NCNKPHDPKANVVINDDKDDCTKACERARELECDERQDLIYPNEGSKALDCQDGICKNGKCTETCEMVCEAFVKEGRGLGLKCRMGIEECSQIASVCRAR